MGKRIAVEQILKLADKADQKSDFEGWILIIAILVMASAILYYIVLFRRALFPGLCARLSALRKAILCGLLAVCCCTANATLTKIFQETFPGIGDLTSGSPGTNFSSVTGTLSKRAVGPGGWSADLNNASTPTYGEFLATAGTSNQVMICAWVYCKSIQVSGAQQNSILAINAQSTSAADFRWCFLSNSIYANQNSWAGAFVPIPPTNQWIFLAVAARLVSAPAWTWDSRYYYMTPGGSLTMVQAYTNLAASPTAAKSYRFGSIEAGGPRPLGNFRMGAVSVYNFTQTNFSDIVYPTDIPQPTNSATIWYVNPSSGSDTNAGNASNAAWQTVTKLNAESANCGLFPATNYAAGDTVVVDTSGSVLAIAGTALITQTQGLNLTAAAGQSYIQTKAYKTLTNSEFSSTTGTAKTFQSADTQTNAVAWEDSKWLNHPAGATWASVSNSVDTVAGSFWTEGTTLYLHPFGDTNPTTDGKVYERSYAFSGAGSAVQLGGRNVNISGLWVQKTSLINKADNTDGIWTTGIGTGNGFGGTSLVQNCYCDYSGKHGIALLADDSNSDVTVLNCQSEQASAYASASPLVSYMSLATSTNNIHRYIGCTVLKGYGLIGSTAGTNSNQSILLSHNNGSGVNFSAIYITNCQFPKGYAGMSVCTNLYVSGGQMGQISGNCPTTTLNSVVLDYGMWLMPYTTTPTFAATNCVFRPSLNLLGGGFLGGEIRGTVNLVNCTFDTTAIPSADNPFRGLLNRVGAATLTVENCALINGANQYSMFMNFTNTDTIVSANNCWNLGSSNIVAYLYTTTNRTWAAWQAAGLDTNSVNSNPCLDSRYRPYAKTPCWTIGAELGPLTDYTGKLFQSRRTAGAYEYATPNPRMLMGRQ